jgi:hypothetical protein
MGWGGTADCFFIFQALHHLLSADVVLIFNFMFTQFHVSSVQPHGHTRAHQLRILFATWPWLAADREVRNLLLPPHRLLDANYIPFSSLHAHDRSKQIKSANKLRSFWFRYYATSRKMVGSVLHDVIRIFNWSNPSSRTTILGSTQLLTEIGTRNLS